MQMNFNNLFLLGAAIIGILAATIFTVDVTQQAIVLRFGQPVKVHSTAGLKAKLPWPIETVQYFDGRVLDVDPAPERVNLRSEETRITKALKEGDPDLLQHAGSIPIVVDTFARYRIVDPLLFLQRLKGEANAQARIEVVMNAATRDVLGKATLPQLLSSQRAVFMGQIRDRVNREMKERGVEIVDVRIGRADLTEQLSDSTVSRMITERREEATETRAKGQEKAQEIKSTAEKERTIILAEAQRDSEIIRGEGDKKAIGLITSAANEDPEFYAYVKTLFAYQNTLASPDTTLVLSPESDFLKYMKSNAVDGK
ncbi:MAG: protease modulator HflC [Proteobacteria bacterium]|nr:protease modulator HflC [Pseudomonadota bacterium]